MVQVVHGDRATERREPELDGVERKVRQQLAAIPLVMAPHYHAHAKAVIASSIPA